MVAPRALALGIDRPTVRPRASGDPGAKLAGLAKNWLPACAGTNGSRRLHVDKASPNRPKFMLVLPDYFRWRDDYFINAAAFSASSGGVLSTSATSCSIASPVTGLISNCPLSAS